MAFIFDDHFPNAFSFCRHHHRFEETEILRNFYDATLKADEWEDDYDFFCVNDIRYRQEVKFPITYVSSFLLYPPP